MNLMNKISPYFFVVLTCFACCIGWWFVFTLITGLTFEDALITFRYAHNIALGNGFVFNTGEYVLGTTTPILTLFLGIIGLIFKVGLIPIIATSTMLCFGIFTGIICYNILNALKYSFLTKILFIPVFFGNTLIMVTSAGGMETPLVIFCMAFSIMAFLQRKQSLCLLILATLLITRPDGIIWATVMFIAIIVQSKKIPYKDIIYAMCIVLPWILFAFWYFGSPVPHSIIAKQLIGSSTSLPPLFSITGIKIFLKWYIGCTGYILSVNKLLLLLWLIFIILGGISYLTKPFKRQIGIVLIVYPILYGFFLYIGKAPHFLWYLTPSSLCIVLLTAPGMVQCANIISKLLQKLNSKLRLGELIIFIIIIYAISSQNNKITDFCFKNQINNTHTRQGIGLWLKNNTPIKSIIAMEAVGYQAFFSERKIIDLAGIISPKIVTLRKNSKSNADFFFKVLSTLKPDYIVLRSFEIDKNKYFHGGKTFNSKKQYDYFKNNYKECIRFTAPYPAIWAELSYLTIYGSNLN